MEQKLQKRLILAVLLVVVFACLAGIAALSDAFVTKASAEVADVWDGDLIAAGWGDAQYKVKPSEYEVTYVDGNSGKVKSIEIGSAAAFAYFAHEVYVDTDHNLDGAEVTLTTSIDLDNHMWIPIGTTARENQLNLADSIRFSGILDGDNHTISNFNTEKYVSGLKYVTKPGENSSDYYIVYEYTGTEKNYADNNKAYIPFKTRSNVEYSYGLIASAYNLTVRNLNVTNVKIDFGALTNDLHGGSSKFQPDSVGTIVGYAMGEVTVNNCVVGSTDHTDNNNTIKLRDDDGGAAAGIIGRLFASDLRNGATFRKVEIVNCVNYLNLDTATSKVQTGGIIGLFNYSVTGRIERCINYGNINSGSYCGGIIGTWTPSNLTAEGTQTDYCWFMDCDNYGNVYSATSTYVGGLIGEFYDNQCKTVKFIADGNVNYGNVGGTGRIGGIFGTTDPGGTGASIMKVITNNYNYGDIYGFNAECVGGYIGYDYSTNPKIYVVSGGNFGTIYGSATFVGQNYGGTNRIGSAGGPAKDNGSVIEKVLTKRFLIAAGEIVPEFNTEDGMPTSRYTEPVFDRHYDAVARVFEDGVYKLSDTNDLTYKYSHTDGTFAYSDNSKTTIIGLEDNSAKSITIPADVTAIGFAAFAGNKTIEVVKFAENSKIATIEDAAFAGCSNLNNVILPANAAKVELGVDVFADTREVNKSAQGALLIAKNSAQYKTLSAWANVGGALTFPVTINYVVDNQPVDGSETRLHGQHYNVEYKIDSDTWVAGTIQLGPVGQKDTSRNWYSSVNGIVFTDQNAGLLLYGEPVDVITLSAYTQSEGKKTFVAREGVAYDKNKTYTQANINELLYSSSDPVDSTMIVSISGYTKPGSNQAESFVPSVIHNAGTYNLTIKVPKANFDEKNPEYDDYNLTVTIEQAQLDLADIANLEWRITQIGTGENVQIVNSQLMSYTLYVYKYSQSATQALRGKEYPSREPLSTQQISALKLENSYEIRTVDYSVARNRGALVTITVIGEGYTVSSYVTSGGYANSAKDVGSYQAQVVLTTDGNYVFTQSSVSKLRGMKIEFDNDNTQATVTKDWYIVDISNWLEGEYSIPDHVFGQSLDVSAPIPHYGTADDVTMTLTRNGVQIGSEFSSNEFNQYITSVMPAGNYTLTVVVRALEAADEDNTMVWHNAYTETFNFTVSKAELPSLTALHGILNGKTFVFEDKATTMYEDSDLIVATYLQQSAYADLSTSIWKDYTQYYSGFGIEYNLLRDHTDSYSASVDVTKPDTYTVYYRIYAENYYSSVENLDNGLDRYSYSFTLIKYHVLPIPTIVGEVTFNGSNVYPTIVNGEDNMDGLYQKIWNDDEYVSGGAHSVTFRLNDKDHYRWEGHEADKNYDAVKAYVVKAAQNTLSSLSMLGWNFETFNPAVNSIRVTVKYLSSGAQVHFYVTKSGQASKLSGLEDFTVDQYGQVTDSGVIEALNNLHTGTYVLHAYVIATDNYSAADTNVDFSVIKSMNAWSAGNDDILLPGWVEGEDPDVDEILVKADHGTANYIITDMEGNEYYNSVTGFNKLKDCEAGKYLLIAWVDETDEYAPLAARTFTIEVFKKVGLPWWGTLTITVGTLLIVALIILILWKKGVFQILTEKLVVAIRTRASVEATIASVRAAKMMEEGKQSVADAKRRERLAQARQRAKERLAMSPEERATELESRAQAEAERAAKILARSEEIRAKAAKMRSGEDAPSGEKPTK